MNKFVIAAIALVLSVGVSANERTGDLGTKSVGGITVATLTSMGISVAVAAAIITNARDSGFVPDEGGGGTNPVFGLICNQGDGEPVNGVCTNNSTTVTVTGTGTNTSTITVPVVTTYPAILTQISP